MCLLTYQKKAKRLKEDLIVYKIVRACDGKYESVFNDFQWFKGVLEKTKMKRGVDACCYDDASTHYQRMVHVNGDLCKILKPSVISISKGFHAALNKKRLQNNFSYGHEEILPFLVPAGSLVYYDDTGLIVSNQMMML